MSNNEPVEKKADGPNRHQRRRADKLARRHYKTEAEMKREASIEAGKEMRKRRVQRQIEAARARSAARKANKVPIVTKAQRKEQAELLRRIEEKKRRRAKYARKLARKATV